MKKYFIHNEIEQLGPFSLNELKDKKLTRNTKIWFNGLDGWTNLEDIQELKTLLDEIPPPFENKNGEFNIKTSNSDSVTPDKSEDMNTEFKKDDTKILIKLAAENFIPLESFVKKTTRNDEIISSTSHSNYDTLLTPSFYLQSSTSCEFVDNFTLPGLYSSLWSYRDKIILCQEVVRDMFLSNYNANNNEFCSLLEIKRCNIIDFRREKNCKFKAIKPKNSYKFLSNLGKSIPAGGLITNLVGTSVMKGASNLSAKLEDDLNDSIGDLYVLKFLDHGNEIELSLACQRWFSPNLLLYLRKNWCKDAPDYYVENSKEELLNARVELLEVGDKFKIPRFFNYDIGTIVSKDKDFAKVKTVKNGVEKLENIKYSKLTLYLQDFSH